MMLTRFYHQLFHSFKRGPKSTSADLTVALSYEARCEYTFAKSELECLLASDPNCRVAHIALGRVLAKSGKIIESIDVLRRAATLWPDDYELQSALGNTCLLDGNASEAISHFRSARASHPSHIPTLIGLGNALREIGNFEEAHHELSRAEKIAPHVPEIYDNLGQLLQDMGQLTESIEKFETALQINPSFTNAQLHIGISRLLAGDFKRGWVGYETRFKATGVPIPQTNYIKWDNQNLPEGTLHILTEQGLGDEIMFASCIPDVLLKVKNIVVECSPKLMNLFQRSFPTVYVVKKNHLAMHHSKSYPNEYAIFIGSLGSFFRREIKDFPAHKGYLIADPYKRNRWREKLLALGPGIKIGIAWSGGTRSTRTTLRSIPLSQWQPLLQTPNSHFISLQYIECKAEIAAVNSHTGITIHHWQEAIDDYDETAALVSELDLIISVQTAIVHLAGSLGKPIWVMVPSCPEWRYLREGTTLPWYPTARLFRQHNRFEWQDVIAEIKLELMKSAQNRLDDPTTHLNDILNSPSKNLNSNSLNSISSFDEPNKLYEKAMELVRLSDFKNALILLQHGLKLNSNDTKFLFASANVQHLCGNYEDAIKSYCQITIHDPNNYLAYTNLGNTWRELTRYNEAIEAFKKALEIAPACAEAAHNLGLCQKALGDTHDAIEYFNRALSTNPYYGAPLRALFEIYREQGDVDTAIQKVNDHIKTHGEFGEAIFLLGRGYYWIDDRIQSERFLRRAITLDPTHSEAWDNLGVTVQDSGRLNEAIEYYSKSIEINPKSRAPRWHRALARLTLGEFQSGWDDYEYRPGVTESLAKYKLPRWNGDANKNTKLVILPEQGLGDEIMFSSCVPDVTEIVGQTVLLCSPKLELLFKRSFPSIHVTSHYPISSSEFEPNTLAIPMGSLPLYFRRKPEDFTSRAPYLKALPSSINIWRHKLNTLGSGLKIGISWRGGTELTRGSMRSLPLNAWLPILRNHDTHFVSLQYTSCEQERSEFATKNNIEIYHWQDAIDDYDQTAALVASLDLVISVQTAVVHLSGALGKPTWVLVPARPEWRYGYDQDSLPWYSNVTIIRQQTPNDWTSVIEEVIYKLKTWTHA